jgi:hypothetical protein
MNISWIFLWQYDYIVLSVLPILALLATLILTYVRLGIGKTHVVLKEALVVRLPFSVYLGWITIASIADIAAALVSMGRSGSEVLAVNLAEVMVLVALAATLTVVLTRRDIAYGLVVIWALVGIAYNQTGTASLVLITEAGAIIIAVAIVTAIATAKLTHKN